MEPTEVTTEQLDKSLKELLNSTEALAKGGIENSGTMSDGKPSGGGQATTKDAGGVDDMMIAKMSSAGVPADMIASFQAFMSKPPEGDDEDDDEDDEGGEPPVEKSNKQQKPSLRKSARERFAEDPSIQQAVEVSPYLDALAVQTAEAIDAVDTSISKSLGEISKRNDRVAQALVKSLTTVSTALQTQGAMISALAKRLGVVEQTPRAPKGKVAQPIVKSGFGNGNDGGGESLTRRELCNTLTFMNLEKGLKTINGFKTSELAVAAEAGGVVAAETLEAAQRFLREHPTEAAKAKAYA